MHMLLTVLFFGFLLGALIFAPRDYSRDELELRAKCGLG